MLWQGFPTRVPLVVSVDGYTTRYTAQWGVVAYYMLRAQLCVSDSHVRWRTVMYVQTISLRVLFLKGGVI